MKKLAKKVSLGLTASAMLVFGSAATSVSAKGSPHKPAWEAHPPLHIKNDATSTYQYGLKPSQVNKAYGVDKLNKTGAGQTIAIVDAYGSPTIQSDLDTFDAQFGLPDTTLQVVYPDGKPNKTDGGWALETAMDVEWAHSIAPDAKIMVVGAKSASITDLVSAIDYATSHGADVVSNSWGGSEFSSETSYNGTFQHSGVTYLASSGDNGAGVSWPASSPDVVAVGGTTLNIDAAGNYVSESAWSGSGGGTSDYESIPNYQDPWAGVVGNDRGVPDVAFDADPNSGVAVYSSTRTQGQKGWFVVGGTSLSAPAWAGLIALADEGRTTPLSSAQALNALYNFSASSSSYQTDFHDITSGDNGGYNAKAGYDLVTGIGSPKADQVIPALSSY